jgi:hypothetical protein
MTDSEPSFNHYALLIGIDAYKKKPLRGCVQDVLAMRDLIMSTPNTSKIRTCWMTAPLPTKNANSNNSLEYFPTYENVKRELDRISLSGEKGNSVYIHYSGHGTAMSPPAPSEPHRIYSNVSTGDLALDLLEDSEGGIRYLRGFEIGNIIARMVAKGLRVALVLDCCYSGSNMRHSSPARFLEYDPSVDARYPAILAQESGSKYRSRAPRPNPLIKPDKFTVLAACGPTELAGEVKLENKHHGMLSYFLIQAFHKMGGFGGEQWIIYQCVCALFQANRTKCAWSQHPMFYGARDSFFLGQISPHIGPSSTLVSGSSCNGFVLDAGKAHGICEGDRFLVHAIPRHTQSGNTDCFIASVSATAVRIEAFKSQLEFSSQPTSGDLDFFATTLTRNSLRSYRVRLQDGVLPLKGWTVALSRYPTLDICHDGHEDEAKLPTFTVEKLEDASLRIQNLFTQAVETLQADQSNMSSKLAELLDHLARFELMRCLVNRESKYLSNRFGETFDIRFVLPDNTKVKPGCLTTENLQAVCTHAECLIIVNEVDEVHLEVSNKETDIQNCLCLHAFALTSTSKIKNIFGSDYEVVPPPRANDSGNFSGGGNGVWRKRLQFEAPRGFEHCDDIVKIFITTKPTSFWSLELPELGAVMERSSHASAETRDSYRLPTDWIAASFRIRTTEKALRGK